MRAILSRISLLKNYLTTKPLHAMKAILINTLTKTVTEIEMKNDIQVMQRLIGCEVFTTVPLRLPDRDMLYVDDEGLFDLTKGFFKIFNYPQPLSGNGLIMGHTADGHSRNVQSNVETIRSIVKFLEIEFFPKQNVDEKNSDRH
jgi:hypothetical protein